MTPDFLNGEDLKQWEDLKGKFRQKLDNMKPASELNGSDFGLFFASAGHAALIDYPTAKGLHKIANDVWSNGGPVAAVCHGPAIFAGVFDSVTKEPIIKGKSITGFTSEAEVEMGLGQELASWGKPLIPQHAQNLGATCKFVLEDSYSYFAAQTDLERRQEICR